MRFTLVAGLWDDFPYQQARGSGQIWFSPELANRKQTMGMESGDGEKKIEMGEKRGEKERDE